MSHKEFTTAHAAAHVAQYNAAQPATTSQVLTLDERIDQVRAALVAAKAQDNQTEIERLRGVWAGISTEIEAEAAPVVAEVVEETTVAAVMDDLTAAADQVRAEAAPNWTNALDFGWSWLLEQDTFRVNTHGALLVPSSRNPANVYTANGECQCEAFMKASGPVPCMHRGAGLIVERWRENVALDQRAAYE